MVKETIDGCWSLPGGWADIGQSPQENVVKETLEESGFEVKPLRLLAVLDKKYHPHPPEAYYVYKIFILCTLIGGKARTSIETSEVAFFGEENLPPLSENRNTESQIRMMFEFLKDPQKETIVD